MQERLVISYNYGIKLLYSLKIMMLKIYYKICAALFSRPAPYSPRTAHPCYNSILTLITQYMYMCTCSCNVHVCLNIYAVQYQLCWQDQRECPPSLLFVKVSNNSCVCSSLRCTLAPQRHPGSLPRRWREGRW